MQRDRSPFSPHQRCILMQADSDGSELSLHQQKGGRRRDGRESGGWRWQPLSSPRRLPFGSGEPSFTPHLCPELAPSAHLGPRSCQSTSCLLVWPGPLPSAPRTL